MTSLKEMEPYQPRQIRWLENETIQDWLLKVYVIQKSGSQIDMIIDDVLDAAFAHVETMVDWPSQPERYGYVTIHFGDTIWLLVDLWCNDILHHFVYYSTYDSPTEFRNPPSENICACVWELEVTKHERDAWVEHVLKRPESPDFVRYMNAQLKVDYQS